MNKLFFLFLLTLSFRLAAQDSIRYVAAKGGLQLREKPAASSPVLEKIPYRTRLSLLETNRELSMRTEGFLGYWQKVRYNNKTGYILDAYTLPVEPPDTSIKTMKAFLEKLAPAHGTPLLTSSNPPRNEDGMGWELQKQLFKNGAEWHEFQGYEYGSLTYFLPGFTTQEAFLLLRLVPEFSQVIGAADPFPLQSKKVKKGGLDFDIKIEKEQFSTEPWIKRIKIEFEEGAIYSFELFQIDNQVVIFYGAGV